MKVRFGSLRREQSGFTLIELMVVVAIIALLTTIAVPWLSAAIRKAKGGVGATELYTFTGGMERYSLDNATGGYPGNLTALLTKGYVRPTTTWKNRFGNPYILVSDATNAAATDASWWVLVDPGNVADTSTITVTCTGAASWTYTVTVNRATVPMNFHDASATPPTALNPSYTTCSLTSNDTNWDAGSANVIRN